MGDPSLSSSFEQLMSGSQRVIGKHMDLALLEGQEVLSRTVQHAAVTGASLILVTATWLAGAGALVLSVAPDATMVSHLAAFAVLNGTVALAFTTLARRRNLLPARLQPAIERPSVQSNQTRAGAAG
jgi:hypothetical protein